MATIQPPPHTPQNALAQGARDTQAAKVVNRVATIYRWVQWILLAFGAVMVVMTYFANIQRGLSYAIPNALLMLAIMYFVLRFLFKLMDNLLLSPWRAMQYRACVRRMVDAIPDMGLNPAMHYQWHLPYPGLIVVDGAQGVAYINPCSEDYERLFLTRDDIIGVKVERESRIETLTKHGGNLALFSSSGFGYIFGHRSRSISTVHQSAFLEIHFQRPGDAAPGWVALPFGSDRREADSMAAALQRL